jgi:hypothetical protein
MKEEMSAPTRPRRWRKRRGESTSAVPKIAGGNRAVNSLAPKREKRMETPVRRRGL